LCPPDRSRGLDVPKATPEDVVRQVRDAGEADAVAWRQLFIATPDLPRRFELDAPLNKPDSSACYAEGETGYTDYPALDMVH